EDVSTLPNLLKKYNPNLQGYSIGTGKEGTQNAANNLAVSGAVTNGLPDQAIKLVTKLSGSSEWKVITIFIGGNDLCVACSDSSYTDTNYYNKMKESIDILKSGLTNTFINIVLPPN
uniref:SGNH/GDSL hydrolase family protein n=1 Tax=Salmonella sp. s51228 TaxID=3159652 RepID=UPI00398158D4